MGLLIRRCYCEGRGSIERGNILHFQKFIAQGVARLATVRKREQKRRNGFKQKTTRLGEHGKKSTVRATNFYNLYN